MTTQAIMTKELITLPPTATVAEALWLMHEHHARNIPVVDEDGCFIGLFGVRRLSRLLLPKASAIGVRAFSNLSFLPDQEHKLAERLREAGKRPISEYLEKKKKLVFCAPDTPFPKLLELLEESRDTSVPVIIVEGKRKKLVGIVSAWDVLERLAMVMLDEVDRTSDPGPGTQSESGVADKTKPE